MKREYSCGVLAGPLGSACSCLTSRGVVLLALAVGAVVWAGAVGTAGRQRDCVDEGGGREKGAFSWYCWPGMLGGADAGGTGRWCLGDSEHTVSNEVMGTVGGWVGMAAPPRDLLTVTEAAGKENGATVVSVSLAANVEVGAALESFEGRPSVMMAEV